MEGDNKSSSANKSEDEETWFDTSETPTSESSRPTSPPKPEPDTCVEPKSSDCRPREDTGRSWPQDAHASSLANKSDADHILDKAAASEAPVSGNRPSPTDTKQELKLSVEQKPPSSQPGDVAEGSHAPSSPTEAKSVILRRPWQSAVATKLSTALSHGSIAPLKRRPQKQEFGSSDEDPNTKKVSIHRAQNKDPTKSPDMALLKQLKVERERGAIGSLDMARRDIRHVPKKLRGKIRRHSTDIIPVVEEHKSADTPQTYFHEEKATRQAGGVSQSPPWKSYYVGSIQLPETMPLLDPVSIDTSCSTIKEEPNGGLSNSPATSNQAQRLYQSPPATIGLATMGEFCSSTKESKKFRKDLPSLLEKSYSFSPVGLRTYWHEPSSCSGMEDSLFLEHLRFLVDGKVTPTRNHPHPSPKEAVEKVAAKPVSKARGNKNEEPIAPREQHCQALKPKAVTREKRNRDKPKNPIRKESSRGKKQKTSPEKRIAALADAMSLLSSKIRTNKVQDHQPSEKTRDGESSPTPYQSPTKLMHVGGGC